MYRRFKRGDQMVEVEVNQTAHYFTIKSEENGKCYNRTVTIVDFHKGEEMLKQLENGTTPERLRPIYIAWTRSGAVREFWAEHGETFEEAYEWASNAALYNDDFGVGLR